MSTIPNPLTGWQGTPQPGMFSPLPQATPIQQPPIGQWYNPGGLQEPFTNLRDIQRNVGLTNIATGQLRNELIPEFARLMTGYAGPPAEFFRNLMDLGGPYYQQRQRQAFEQGVGQAQGAAGQARQQLARSGFGYGPSGAGAAMFGGMGQAEAGNLSQRFLEQLFQNENLQMQGARGLEDIAKMFDVARLFGMTSGLPETRPSGAAMGLDFLTQLLRSGSQVDWGKVLGG